MRTPEDAETHKDYRLPDVGERRWRALMLDLRGVINTLQWGAEKLRPDPRDYAHDVAIFKEMDEVVDEPLLDNLLNTELNNHWCRREDIVTLRHFCEDMRRIENEYLDRKLKREAAAMIAALAKVDEFVGKHFFSVGDPSEGRLKFHPQQSESARDDAVARLRAALDDAHARNLRVLIDDAWEAFREYRRMVKKRLKV